MRRLLGLALIASPLLLGAGYAVGAPESEYDREVVSVSTFGLHAPIPTANCLVWANAEDLGVGPAELGGMHGISMNMNMHPLPSEGVKTPTTFDVGFAEMKARFPNAPAWLFKTIEKNRPAIEKGCAQDHQVPLKVYTITARDKQN